jgi:cation diffusion facilitator CzcD-associated flavoprotein CzcO
VQIVPAIADDVAHLIVFQRSASHVVPKPDRRYSPAHRALFRRLPGWGRLVRAALMAVFERAGAVRSAAAAPVQAAFRALLRAQVPDGALRAGYGRRIPSAPGGSSSRRTTTAR